MIFVEDIKDEIIPKLKKFVEDTFRIPVFSCLNDKDVSSVRTSCADFGEEVALIVPMIYGRGTNFKFTKDSVVFVICNEMALSEVEVWQMIGRSSRSRGTHRAIVYFWNS